VFSTSQELKSALINVETVSENVGRLSGFIYKEQNGMLEQSTNKQTNNYYSL